MKFIYLGIAVAIIGWLVLAFCRTSGKYADTERKYEYDESTLTPLSDALKAWWFSDRITEIRFNIGQLILLILCGMGFIFLSYIMAGMGIWNNLSEFEP